MYYLMMHQEVADHENRHTMFDSIDSARNWMSDPRLGQALQEAGVLIPRPLTYLQES